MKRLVQVQETPEVRKEKEIIIEQEHKIKLLVAQIEQLKEENKSQRIKIIEHVKE